MKKIIFFIIFAAFASSIIFFGIRYSVKKYEVSKKKQSYVLSQNNKSKISYVPPQEGRVSKSLTYRETMDLYDKMDNTDAIRFLSLKIKEHHKDPVLYWMLSSKYRFSNHKKAIELLKKAVAIQPNQLQFVMDLANALSLDQQYDEAIRVYKRAKELAADPQHYKEDRLFPDMMIKKLKREKKQKKIHDKEMLKLAEEAFQYYKNAKKTAEKIPAFQSAFHRIYNEKVIEKLKQSIKKYKSENP